MTTGVTVGTLLRSRPEALGLDLELLAGAGGLDRRILSPYVQKTGLALAGFHEYLREGRVLVFGNSEVRYEPAESDNKIKGGNSNWRGPVWFPTSFLMIESLRKLGKAYGPHFSRCQLLSP